MYNEGMKQTELHLTEPDRGTLNAFRGKGVRPARAVNRAHVLMALDQGVPEATICQVLGLGRTALWRTRAAYREGGLEFALARRTSFRATAEVSNKPGGRSGGLGM